ncbi:E3 ubiquitin-protein ligase [Lachnellula hyalina]|uniref:E3 ubiquitin-protein ligase n=1 Tax=Lachnellula hyalina TaxID=1316788 RepID=A0A8H8R5D4_9HELO|nr:E3 ubiquitin-protein ligase [Lachnellula hyalina]TVY28758.1 E3 ubiquitin-protein ligase [Lachnellula hyalina]
MSASLNAASSLSRSTATILTLTTLAAAYGTYYLYSSSASDTEIQSRSGPRLSRRNAVHRRRRRTTAGPTDRATEGRSENNTDDVSNLFGDEGSENNSGEQLIPRTLTDGDTVVDDQEDNDNPWTRVPEQHEQPERSGQNIVQLLFRVSEDATRRNAYVHRGCACNSCGIVPIRGIRYRCANCADYDLCEGCESQGVHTKTHIFYKIKVPGPSFGPRSIQPVLYAGDPDSVMRVLPKEITTKLSRETGFERPELDAYWEQWTFMASTDWKDDPDDINLAMDRKTFECCLVPSGGYRHTSPSLIFDRMFAFYDTNKDDLIGFPEFLNGIAYRKKKDKWRRIFEGYDIDGDGFVDRKDFLRMFRSYYVLYRQMHRDMLESMEEQQMSCTDAHRLVAGRQPLSSAFGQDGRYPRAPDYRTGEGKTAQPNGDLEISDGQGIMNENSKDRGNREDIFRQNIMLLSRYNQIHREHSHGEDTGGYWETMRNPPTSLGELDPMVRAMRRNRDRADRAVTAATNMSRNAHPALVTNINILEDEDNTSVDSDDISTGADNDYSWLPNYATVTDQDAEAIDGPGARVSTVHPSSRRTVIAHAVYRERAEEAIHERWKRRQFYTDEEEGATPPVDWKEHDDVFATNEVVGESSKSQSRPSMHSRSSSKVRFAEDMDDFDTRSNPSTSSRSVPERWGGMGIPDAERDAGKEILYQVTQQAFNELLDPLFKEKEDLAVEAAANKEQRERWRYEYTKPKFFNWAFEKEKEAKEKQHAERSHTPLRHETRQPWPTFPEVEVEEVRQRPLDDLLNHTGYYVDGPDEESDGTPELEVIPEIEPSQPADSWRHNPLLTGDIYQDPESPEPSTLPIESTRHQIPASQYEGRDRTSSPSPRATPSGSPDSTWSIPSSSASSYHDPTLPQFRPDSVSSTSFSPNNDAQPRNRSTSPSTTHALPISLPSRPAPSSDCASTDANYGQRPGREILYRYWLCERVAMDAEEKGGWGRLSLEEFETAVKRFVREGRGNQMDYLGSWIDFCIP